MTRILMLGNSLTTANDMPRMLKELTGAEVVVHARGGARLAEHLNPKTRLGTATQQALAHERWDYVVLQEMSHGPATSKNAFLKAATALARQIRDAGAQPVIYATWAYAPSCPKYTKLGMTYEEMAIRMNDAFCVAAQETEACIAAVGERFTELSDLSLYASDGVHPSEAGSRVAAEIIARTMA